MTFTGQPETMRFQTAEFLGPVSDAPKYIQISYQVGYSIYIQYIYIYTIIKLVTVYIYIWYCKAISFGWCSKGKCRPVSVTNRPIMQAMLLRIAGGYVPGVEAGPQVTDVARLFVHSS